MNKIFIGSGSEPVYLYTNMLNRHSLIAGATGTGKTITLKVIAEKLSDLGIPSFMADIKGDLTSLIEAGSMNEKIQERLNLLQVDDYKNKAFPVELWDVYGENGLPLRTTVSDMGPLMLSRILSLNDVQEGVLNVLFKVADESGLLLLDLKDLKSMLTFLEENRDALQKDYGTISSQSIGAIRRSLLVLENQGANEFFGEPALDIKDFITQKDGRGIINILSCQKLFQSPKLYSGFIFWLLSELYENLPEVGDLDQPKLVFFFDEAHVLFDDENALISEKIELVIRLIRSKAVGICFITQNPIDIPDNISSQIGNRIQHGLRAFSPKEKKVIKNIAELFPGDHPHLEDDILNLGTGEAVVSCLNEKSIPIDAMRITVMPPMSKIGTVDAMSIQGVLNASSFSSKYAERIDNYSAYEALQERSQQSAQQSQQIHQQPQQTSVNENNGGFLNDIVEAVTTISGSATKHRNRRKSELEKITGSMMNTIGRELGRQLVRGIFGTRRR